MVSGTGFDCIVCDKHVEFIEDSTMGYKIHSKCGRNAVIVTARDFHAAGKKISGHQILKFMGDPSCGNTGLACSTHNQPESIMTRREDIERTWNNIKEVGAGDDDCDEVEDGPVYDKYVKCKVKFFTVEDDSKAKGQFTRKLSGILRASHTSIVLPSHYSVSANGTLMNTIWGMPVEIYRVAPKDKMLLDLSAWKITTTARTYISYGTGGPGSKYNMKKFKTLVRSKVALSHRDHTMDLGSRSSLIKGLVDRGLVDQKSAATLIDMGQTFQAGWLAMADGDTFMCIDCNVDHPVSKYVSVQLPLQRREFISDVVDFKREGRNVNAINVVRTLGSVDGGNIGMTCRQPRNTPNTNKAERRALSWSYCAGDDSTLNDAKRRRISA